MENTLMFYMESLCNTCDLRIQQQVDFVSLAVLLCVS